MYCPVFGDTALKTESLHLYAWGIALDAYVIFDHSDIYVILYIWCNLTHFEELIYLVALEVDLET